MEKELKQKRVAPEAGEFDPEVKEKSTSATSPKAASAGNKEKEIKQKRTAPEAGDIDPEVDEKSTNASSPKAGKGNSDVSVKRTSPEAGNFATKKESAAMRIIKSVMTEKKSPVVESEELNEGSIEYDRRRLDDVYDEIAGIRTELESIIGGIEMNVNHAPDVATEIKMIAKIESGMVKHQKDIAKVISRLNKFK